MLYVIIASDNLDKPNHQELRQELRPAHLKRLEELEKQDRLVLAGPVLRDDTDDLSKTSAHGTIIVAKFNSLTEAQTWINEDPYSVNDVYFQITVLPYKQVFPK